MKLTTELLQQLKSAAQEEIMCREASDTSDAWQDLASPENILTLIEIALPVLDGRIKSKLLPSKVFNRLYDQYLMGVICGNGNKTAAKDFLEACFVAIYDLVQPTTDTYRQIENDGWIEWGGGDCPVATHEPVEARFKGVQFKKIAKAGKFYWHHFGNISDIIAYRVIENDGKEE